MRRNHVVAIAAIAAVLTVAVGAYRAVVPGLSVARQSPSAIEVAVATWLLHHTVPESALQAHSMLGPRPDPADVAAGARLFRQKCEVCHAYDGGGKTEIGSGQYPRPPTLKSLDVTAMPDGEMFYHIQNGIRNTGMPAWSLPDRQIWQLVAHIRSLPAVAALSPDQRIERM